MIEEIKFVSRVNGEFPVDEVIEILNLAHELRPNDENLSGDLPQSLKIVLETRLSSYTIAIYQGKILGFCGAYNINDWVVGGVRAFTSPKVPFDRIFSNGLLDAQYKLIENTASAFALTFNTRRIPDAVKARLRRPYTRGQSFWNKFVELDGQYMIYDVPQWVLVKQISKDLIIPWNKI